MSKAAEFLLSRDGDELVLEIIGTMDERADFEAAYERIVTSLGGAKQVSFDLGRVASVNSAGILGWARFIEKVREKLPCEFRVLDENFIESASVSPDIIGIPPLPVRGFEAPYYCASCDQRIIKVLKTDQLALESGFIPPAFQCAICHNPLAFDAMEIEYFKSLRHMKRS